MPSLKAIRKRLASVKSTQKITRAMKMVAAARLRRAQQRITELRPFAQKTSQVLASVVRRSDGAEELHPLLARREEHDVLLVVFSSDRGLAGGFNTQISRATERLMREMQGDGKRVALAIIGRKARDYFRRRGGEIVEEIPGVTEKIDLSRADEIAAQILDLYLQKKPLTEREGVETLEAEPPRDTPFDAVYLVYNEFKSAMTQRVSIDKLLPVGTDDAADDTPALDLLYEPSRDALLDRLLPLYVFVTVYRALLESVASYLGAQMTAMDSATNNAKDMIAKLTLDYNRARQAAITKELMEIIGGAEALK